VNRSRIGAAAALLLVIAFVPGGPAGAQEDCGQAPPMEPLTFEAPDVFDTVRAGGEPGIETLPDGTLLYASHASTTLFYRDNMPDADYATPYTGSTYMWRSTDFGDNWRYVGLAETEVGPHAATISGFSDPDFAVDSAGNAYTAGINLANVYVAKSSDSGKTWTGHPFAALGTDREWLAADEPDVVYMNGNSLVQGRRLWKSTDGGITWNFTSGEALPGGGPPSKIHVDKSDGRLYFPDGGGGVAIYPNARQDDYTRIDAELPGGGPHAHGFLNALALDRAGNVYHVGNTGNAIQVSYSTDRGLTWTTQTIHNAAPNTVLWPWITAGADGRVGVSWFQADRPVSSTDSVPASYRVHAAQTLTGHGWTDECGESHPPVYEVAVATPEPFHNGTICSQGTICQVGGTDRRLGDYHTNSVTTDGRMVIAYSDTSLEPESAISKPGFIRQSGGIDFHPDVPTPTTVGAVEATPGGGTLAVSGSASFGGETPVHIAEDMAGDGPVSPDASRDLGVDLTGARVFQPDPDVPELVFEWHVTDLPSPSSLPEAIRYTWPFKVVTPTGEKLYQLQAKYSNLASITLADDPAGHARPPGQFFQLRGNCVANYPMSPGPANCPHIAWLTGSFDQAGKRVRIRLPLNAPYAPDIKPGAALQRNLVINLTITASYQAVVSNADTSDEALWEEERGPYTVPTKDVRLGIAPAGTDPDAVTYGAPAALDADGGFSGDLSTVGLDPGAYAVYVKACFAANCGVATAPFTI